jgi:CDGSH-type Zn-finger protein
VFNPAAKPWIQPDKADPAPVADAVNRCPSGALRMQFADGTSAMVVPPDNHGQVTANGPNYLRGKLSLHEGESVLEDTRVALCRCGASQHKPFCDNSHKKIGFVDPGTLPAAHAPPAGVDPAAPLAIRLTPNGPVVCTGPLTLHGSDGRTAFSETTFLCRCGGSHNKPYCDGTHKKIGFTS